MSIERATFFGASVSQVNSSIGWNNQESRLELTLVEDLRNGDAFLPPPVGSPINFSYGAFSFGGILQSVSSTSNNSANPTYNVSVIDPRSLLGGVQVILSDYIGAISVPNVINVFGYYEAGAFGSSGVTAGGMQWTKVRTAIEAIINGDTPFGGRISYKGYYYRIDITNLPFASPYFRLSGSMSLMDLILQVCEIAGYDLFVTLENDTVVIYTLNRATVPNLGVIPQFITSTDGANLKSIGSDMVNESCGKFLIGSKKRKLISQQKNTNTDDGFHNKIWPFWNFTHDGDPVVGTGFDDDHVFTLDARTVKIPGVPDFYPTSLGEIRAALSSPEDWQSYLSMHNEIDYLINSRGESTAAFPGTEMYYTTNQVDNPHLGKATAIGMYPNFDSDIVNFLNQSPEVNASLFPIDHMIQLIPGKKENAIDKLYDMIRSYAEDHYGKKFMVALTSVQAYQDPELQTTVYSMSPCESAYIPEGNIQSLINSNQLPVDINLITNEDNTIRPFVRFDSIGDLDFSDIPEANVLYSADGNSIFLECQIEGPIYFLRRNDYTSARVTIVLPGRVVRRKEEIVESTFAYQMALNFLQQNAVDDPQESLKRFGASPLLVDGLDSANYVEAAIPDMAVVTLEDQRDRYGPWTSFGATGIMDYEEDESLNPWNYGGEANMNLAALAKTTESIANLQDVESGAIDFPGVPDISLGQQLLSTGPYVSNIQINMSKEGVTTTYRMETWKPRFGTINKLFADRIEKLGQEQLKMKRNMREKFKVNNVK